MERSRTASFAEGVHVATSWRLAEALLALERPAEAASVLQSVLKRGNDDFGFSAARHDARQLLATAFLAQGDIRQAADVYKKMEDVLSDWRSSGFSGARTPQATALLRTVRLEYADVLDKLGKPKDAQKMRDEAAKLK